MNGDPVIYLLIFVGKYKSKLYETGIKLFTEEDGDIGDNNYFNNNSRPGKIYSVALTYNFQGKDVLCLTRWILKSSITLDILVNNVTSLELLGIFD